MLQIKNHTSNAHNETDKIFKKAAASDCRSLLSYVLFCFYSPTSVIPLSEMVIRRRLYKSPTARL